MISPGVCVAGNWGRKRDLPDGSGGPGNLRRLGDMGGVIRAEEGIGAFRCRDCGEFSLVLSHPWRDETALWMGQPRVVTWMGWHGKTMGGAPGSAYRQASWVPDTVPTGLRGNLWVHLAPR